MAHARAMGVVGAALLGTIVLAHAGGDGGSTDPRPREILVPRAVAGPAQPDPADAARDALPRDASPVERAILERLDRLERGLFRRGSTLPKSETDSIERRLEELAPRELPPPAPPADAAAIRDIRTAIDQLDREIERDVADVLERLERTIEEIDRRASRETDLPRRLDDLARAIERVERRLESIERRIR